MPFRPPPGTADDNTPAPTPPDATCTCDGFAFAIFGILLIEAGLLTPPFGLVVYVVKGAVPDSGVNLAEIFRGSIPYWLLMLLTAGLIWAYPPVASWLTTFV